MKLTDKEIETIAKPFLETASDMEFGEQMTCIEEFGLFARAIEAAIEAKAAPKFKVGDRVTLCGHGIPGSILKGSYSCHYHFVEWDDRKPSEYSYDEAELEAVEEEA